MIRSATPSGLAGTSLTDRCSVSKPDNSASGKLWRTLGSVDPWVSFLPLFTPYTRTGGTHSKQLASTWGSSRLCRDLEAFRPQIPPQLHLKPIPWLPRNNQQVSSMTCLGNLAKHDDETALPRRNGGWLNVDCLSKAWSRNALAYHDSSWLAFRFVHIRRTRQVGTQEVRGLGGERFAGFTW